MKSTIWLASLLSIAVAAPVGAEILEIPQSDTTENSSDPVYPSDSINTSGDTYGDTGDQNNQVDTVTLPGKGMSKDAVEARFGSPTDKSDAIGEPPITRWNYGGFTVYFEYDHVIHAVNHK